WRRPPGARTCCARRRAGSWTDRRVRVGNTLGCRHGARVEVGLVRVAMSQVPEPEGTSSPAGHGRVSRTPLHSATPAPVRGEQRARGVSAERRSGAGAPSVLTVPSRAARRQNADADQQEHAQQKTETKHLEGHPRSFPLALFCKTHATGVEGCAV